MSENRKLAAILAAGATSSLIAKARERRLKEQCRRSLAHDQPGDLGRELINALRDGLLEFVSG